MEERLPSSLVQTYFRLFEVAVRTDEKKKEADEAVAMRGRLLSALLTGVNRAHPYLAKSLGELDEHVNSLYRVVHKSPPSACTQALLLLFHLTVGTALEREDTSARELTDEQKSHQKRFYISLYSKLGQPSMVGSGKHLTMLFNLVYKSMKYDSDKNRVLAFAKRILCTTIHCNSAVVSASLFLLNEIGKFHPEVLQCHREVLEGNDALRSYDMREQDPSKAIKSPSSGEESGQSDTLLAPAWEMCMAIHHYHPTVQAFARNLGGIEYTGDPLRDFTLAPFLDKFAYRNPKSSEKGAEKFASVAERRSGKDRKIEGQSALPFNDPSFIHKQNVEAEDQFFHQYFVEQAKRDEIKGITRRKVSDDRDSDDEFAEEDDAFGAAEADVSDFGKYEQHWESDEEEEAFVDSLAQKIIEDSMDANELGPDELDAEDPDMDDWDDMYSDEEENVADGDHDDEDSDVSQAEGNDDFLDSDVEEQDDKNENEASESSSDENEKARRKTQSKLEADEDAFMDDSDDESHDEELEEEDIDPELDEDDEDDMGWINEDDDGEDEVEQVVEKSRDKKKGKRAKDMTTFASLEDYEERINESWNQIKRSSETPDRSDEEREASAKRNKKKRRRR